MPFLQLTLTIDSADPAPFEAALFAAGAESITLQDAGDEPVLEPALGETPLWPRVQIKALFAGAADPDDVLAKVRAELSQPSLTAHVETVQDRTWEREWLRDFQPMRFGRRLWICPGGQRPPQPAESQARAAGLGLCLVELDPGLAFGTGTHATTALCLEWLDGAQLAGKRVIDYGCGSGILAISALKLGACAAVCVDIDPQALQATQENAARNGVSERLEVALPRADMPFAAEVLLANVLAEPLEQLAPTLSQLVVPGGSLVLSGILQRQAEAVASRYSAWFDIRRATVREDWVRLEGVRRSAARAC